MKEAKNNEVFGFTSDEPNDVTQWGKVNILGDK